MVNNLNEKRPFAGDVQAAPDNVSDLRHLFHRVCLHLVQLATAIVPLEGEQKRTFWSRASSSPFGHNPIVLNIDGKLAIANCNALAEQVLNICKCCLRCHSLFSCCWDCQVLLFHLSNTRPECIRLGLSTCWRRLRVFNPKYVYQYERVKQAVNWVFKRKSRDSKAHRKSRPEKDKSRESKAERR